MHLHRVALIAVIVAITSEISRASTQCKQAVMDVHMKKCRFGVRAKRDAEELDFQKFDTKSKRQAPNYSKMVDDSSHGLPRKRQLSPLEISQIAMPIVKEAINGAVKAKSYTSETVYQNPSLLGSVLGQPEYYKPDQPASTVTSLLSRAISDDFVLNLNTEELDELYSDIYGRLPRASKEETWKVFLDIASKCCQNVEKCLKEGTHVPCLTF